MSTVFDHRHSGTAEEQWAASGLDRLPALRPPLADARVLVVAAHPDDESLGAGGLISDAAARSARIHVLVASDGEASHPRSRTHSPQRLAARRRLEVVEAVAALARSATVEFLGLPDGGLSACGDGLAAAIGVRLSGCTHVVSPWRGDRHPDHDACAAAVRRAVAGRTDIQHWQYPIWAWHWAAADPDSHADPAADRLPWPDLRRLDLTDGAVRDKRTAIGCHLSQHSPLSDAEGDEAILPRHVQAHFTREFETFVVEPAAPAGDAGYFDRLYDDCEDPWGLAARFYERRKRDLLLASLPRERFRRAFEPGCATGRLTAELAARCEAVLAWDGAGSAVRQAREYVGAAAVTVEQRRIPHDWPEGPFDLVVLSEVGYYCDDLALLARRVRDCLAVDGVLVACHWNHPAPDHRHSAAAVHDALAADLGLIATHRERDFRLDVWSVSGRSVASAEGIIS